MMLPCMYVLFLSKWVNEHEVCFVNGKLWECECVFLFGNVYEYLFLVHFLLCFSGIYSICFDIYHVLYSLLKICVILFGVIAVYAIHKFSQMKRSHPSLCCFSFLFGRLELIHFLKKIKKNKATNDKPVYTCNIVITSLIQNLLSYFLYFTLYFTNCNTSRVRLCLIFFFFFKS